MSTQLTFGGSSVQLSRDTGTTNSVQGFITDTVTNGGKLSSPLETTHIFYANTAAVQYSIIALARTELLKVLGSYRVIIDRLKKIDGIWVSFVRLIKINGEWK
jgi:hypothetical protein